MTDEKSKQKEIQSRIQGKVALEAIKEQKTIAELALQFDIHPTQIVTWKKRFLENSAAAFSEKQTDSKENEAAQGRLYEQIGKL